MASFLKNLGHRKVVLKSDGEPSVVALKEAAAKETGIDWISEESPVGDHQANGLAENACKEVKRQVRVLRSALEEKLSKELKDDDPALAWLPRQAGDLLSRYKKGQDGRTPEARRCGKQWRKPAIAFGERLYFREVGEGVRILKEGRYVGHHGRTGSILVTTADGVRRGTGIRRLSSADRWDPSGWDLLRGLPWEHSAARPAGEQLMLEERLCGTTSQGGTSGATTAEASVHQERGCAQAWSHRRLSRMQVHLGRQEDDLAAHRSVQSKDHRSNGKG